MTKRSYSNLAPPLPLSVAVSTSATTLTVSSTTGYPTAPFIIGLERGTASEEVVLCTALTSTTFTVTRGYDGTSGKTHAIGTMVEHTVSAIDYREGSLTPMTTAERDALAGVNLYDGLVISNTTTDKVETYQGATWFTLSDNVALALKANIASPTFTGTVSGITSAMVGLANVQNIDATNASNLGAGTVPDSRFPDRLATGGNAQASGANFNNAVNTGWYTGFSFANSPSSVGGGDSLYWQVMVHQLAATPTYCTQLAYSNTNPSIYKRTLNNSVWTAWVKEANQTDLDLKAPLASPTFTGTVSGVTKTHVGLSNVDNTSDAAKPVSTATQTALNAKAPVIDVQTFTTSGTWTKPSGAAAVEVLLIGGGGGGGSGTARHIADANGTGGAGGSGGGISYYGSILPADLAATVAVTIGAGGGGGTAVSLSSGSQAGNVGSAGGQSSLGTSFTAGGGLGGPGGDTSNGTTTVGGVGNRTSGGTGGAQSGGAGSLDAPANPTGTGGGGGGGRAAGFNTATPAPGYAGGQGQSGTPGSGGTSSAAAQDGTAGSAGTGTFTSGGASGGGGGAGAIKVAGGGTGGTGGAGAIIGAGGGGGGGAANDVGTQTSGTGGAGARGVVIVITRF